MFVFKSYKLVEGILFYETLKSMIFLLYFRTTSANLAVNVLRRNARRELLLLLACEKIFKKQLDGVQCGAVEAGIYKVNVAVNF